MFSLTEYTLEAYSPQTGFQHIVLPLWSTVDAQTDANFIASSTIPVVSKNGSVASHCSQTFLPVTIIAKMEVRTGGACAHVSTLKIIIMYISYSALYPR